VNQKQTPAVPLRDPRFQYTPAAATDVQKTWMRFGWTPPSKKEQR
jgi:hypothetical protein